MGASMLVESLDAASMLVESLDAAVLVEQYILTEKTSGLVQPVLAVYPMEHLQTLVQQEVFPRPGRPALHTMAVFVHRRHVPNCTTYRER